MYDRYINNKNKSIKRRIIIMESSVIHFKIDKDLKTELQIIAVKKNTNITAILTDLIQDYVNENK